MSDELAPRLLFGALLGLGLVACHPKAPDTAQPAIAPPVSEPVHAPVDSLPLGIEPLERLSQKEDLEPKLRARLRVRLAALYTTVAESLDGDERTKHHAMAADLLRAAYVESTDAKERGALALSLYRAKRRAGPPGAHSALLRHLVCPDKYPEGDPVNERPPAPLPQDHTPRYWSAWEMWHLEPIDVSRAKKKKPKGRERTKASGGDEPASAEEETVFRSLYDNCGKPKIPADEAARAWMMLGDDHRLTDVAGGPFVLNRAVSAYENALAASPGSEGADVALLRLGTTYQSQGRHSLAVSSLVSWLSARERRAEIATAAIDPLARSLTFVDFVGPGASDPFVVRSDTLDTEPNPHVAERKMRVGIDRLRDPRLVPQAAPFTVDVYVAVAREYRSLQQFENVLEVLGTAVERFPLERDLPRLVQMLTDTAGSRPRFFLGRTQSHGEALLAEADAWRRVDAVMPGSPWATARRGEKEAVALRDALIAKRSTAEPLALVLAASDFLDAAHLAPTPAEIESMLTRARAALARAEPIAPEPTATVAAALSLAVRAMQGEAVAEQEWEKVRARAAGDEPTRASVAALGDRAKQDAQKKRRPPKSR